MPIASAVTIHNEQTKLWAAQLERMGTAAFSIGVLGPLAAAFFKIEGFRDPFPVVMGMVCWMFLAVIFYIESQRALRRLAQ